MACWSTGLRQSYGQYACAQAVATVIGSLNTVGSGVADGDSGVARSPGSVLWPAVGKVVIGGAGPMGVGVPEEIAWELSELLGTVPWLGAAERGPLSQPESPNRTSTVIPKRHLEMITVSSRFVFVLSCSTSDARRKSSGSCQVCRTVQRCRLVRLAAYAFEAAHHIRLVLTCCE